MTSPAIRPSKDEIEAARDYLDGRQELYQRQAVSQVLNGNVPDAAKWEEEANALRTLLSALASAEEDTARLAILNAAIEDDRLIVDNNALKPVEAYPPDSGSDLDRYVVYDLTDAADELIAHAEKLAADPLWRQTVAPRR